MNNPFRYGRVVGGEDFCPRPALQKQLEGYIRADQNASIQGERRLGKSSIALAAVAGTAGRSTSTCSAYARPKTFASASPRRQDASTRGMTFSGKPCVCFPGFGLRSKSIP